MRQFIPPRTPRFHCFPPPGAEGRKSDGVSDWGALPESCRHEVTGPTPASPWTNSPPFWSTRHPVKTCLHSPNPAPVVLAVVFAAAPPPGPLHVGDPLSATPRPPCHSLSPCSTQHSERGVAFLSPGGFHSRPFSSCTPPHASLRVDPTPGRRPGEWSSGPAHLFRHPRLPRRRTE